MKGALSLFVLLSIVSAIAAAAVADSVQGRIVGGQSTTIEQYPSIVQVESLGVLIPTWGQSCGATVLTSRWILSAAHCFAGVLYRIDRRRIRAGSTWRNQGGTVIYAEREFNRPDYNVVRRDGDVSVVRLAEPLVFSPAVQTVTIVAQGSLIPDNSPVVHAGWGALQSEGSAPPDLQDVTIYTINREDCRRRYAQAGAALYPVTDGMLCAGIVDVGGKDACQGDSGGPLYLGGIQVGVVSWGIGCAHEFYPGVNANVASYSNWIIETVANNS